MHYRNVSSLALDDRDDSTDLYTVILGYRPGADWAGHGMESSCTSFRVLPKIVKILGRGLRIQPQRRQKRPARQTAQSNPGTPP